VNNMNNKIVFTNGCFDILHVGHIMLLKECKSLGKVIVGLNSDLSVQKLKGLSRPINNQTDRKLILESIKYVDKVIIFDEETPENLIKSIKPNILVKGDDWKTVIGGDYVKSYGGKVILIPHVRIISTTNIVNKCKGI
jgi:rfaE bifunctional protein nucleotidyltransferase chain/domain